MKLFNFIVIALCSNLSACTDMLANQNGVYANIDDSSIARWGKSDMDEVIEVHQRAAMKNLKALMVKLYHRNPQGRHDAKLRTIEESVNLTFSRSNNYYPQWEPIKATDIVRIALDESYQGSDRVLPLIVGLRKMIMASYEDHTEFFYLTSIDGQKLYNSARNIEIAAWMLAENRNVHGQLLLLSDSVQGEHRNLSYQRLIGQLIATQDNLALIMANKSGRLLKNFVVTAASMVFLPI
ncbi:hypothetical protein LCGC14_0897170 [marine sediment metagenome]|uniref:Uncharacterized protein n=1 Tax=marine sediment metagenome TaxID=412755 RepID=A0A0F9P2C2_9ZZZZ